MEPPIHTKEFVTEGGLRITRQSHDAHPDDIDAIVERLESHVGAVFTSGVDYPGRYTRWEFGYHSPILLFRGTKSGIRVESLSERGHLLLPWLAQYLSQTTCSVRRQEDVLNIEAPEVLSVENEDDRSKRVRSFVALREVMKAFRCDDEHLGLCGAFAYDLMFTFEDIEFRHARESDPTYFALHLPDELVVCDRSTGQAHRYQYDFAFEGMSTENVPRKAVPNTPIKARELPESLSQGTYAGIVEKAKAYFARGDLYEVVPGQPLYGVCNSTSTFFRNLKKNNPAPYGFFISLGEESLIGASPEMYVRVEGNRVETCPISGTIKRGSDGIDDAKQILTLLNSEKDKSELTMCTDVDRNDKARVCIPGSIEVIGRRQIELYSRLIHTVDHVVGTLRPECDALDAFLSHMWAVTVTGAPKKWATQFIEDHEEAPRGWYGGAVGKLGCNGNLNTGLTLRTAFVRDGVALVRAGATLLYDSDPQAEEAETELKASTLLRSLPDREQGDGSSDSEAANDDLIGTGYRVLVIDHEDSFTLNLADYFKQTGATVISVRWGEPEAAIATYKPDLLVLSPGPGRPQQFNTNQTLQLAHDGAIPVFGVCLGLQAIVEWAGGTLSQLVPPVHGKSSMVQTQEGTLFGESSEIPVGRYHSLYCPTAEVPDAVQATAWTHDGVVMAIEHRTLPVWGVQFHPESIMTAEADGGIDLVNRVMTAVKKHAKRQA